MYENNVDVSSAFNPYLALRDNLFSAHWEILGRMYWEEMGRFEFFYY